MQDGGPARPGDQEAVEALPTGNSVTGPASFATAGVPAGSVSLHVPHMSSPAQRLPAIVPHALLRWLPLCRPATLVCVEAPLLVTVCWLWARGTTFAWFTLVVTALAVALVLVGTHVLKAYLDYAHDQRRLATPGNVAAARSHPLLTTSLRDAGIYPLDALRVAAVLLALGAVLGALLGVGGGTPVFVLGASGLLVALLYAASAYAPALVALGEIAVCLTLGPGIVAFTLLAQREPVTSFALWVGLALGLFAAALLESAHLLAITPEQSDHRLTLVRGLGRWPGRLLFVVTLVAAYLAVIVPALLRGAPHGALAVLFSLPVAILPFTGALRASNAATLRPVVRQMLRAYVAFAFWLAIGLLLGWLYLRLLKVIGA